MSREAPKATIASTVAAVLSGRAVIDQAISALLARPLKHEG